MLLDRLFSRNRDSDPRKNARKEIDAAAVVAKADLLVDQLTEALEDLQAELKAGK